MLNAVSLHDEPLIRTSVQSFLEKLASWPLRGNEVDEIGAEVLFKFFRKLEQGPVREPVGWMLKAAALIRKSRHRRLQDLREVPLDPGRIESRTSSGPLRLPPAIRSEIAKALDSLSVQQRQAATLCFIQGLTALQAAKEMGVPLNTMKSWLRRARTHLRQHLERTQNQLTRRPRNESRCPC